MSTNAQLQAFWSELSNLRGRPGRLTPSEIAQVARKAGILISEALSQIQRHSEFRYIGSNEIADALVTLISTICSSGGTTRVLEYTVMPSLLTAYLAESDNIRGPSYVVP
jgi:hypothetical protein